MNLVFSRSFHFRFRQNVRVAMALSLALTVFFTTLSFGVSASAEDFLEPLRHEHDNYVLYRDEQGAITCREATEAESAAIQSVSPKDLRPINHLGPELFLNSASGISESAEASRLTIILLGTTNLNNNAAAKAAFTRAAAAWEARVTSPITIYIQADFGPNFFGESYPSGVLGQTGGVLNAYSYSSVRNSLIARANSAAKAAVYNALPTSSVPTDVGNAGGVAVANANARAIGLLPATANSTDPAPKIGFNSANGFDFDRSNGISSGQFDFEAVATHEIGHALGFTSQSGQGSTPAMWDLYRFRSGTTATTFTTALRIMTRGGTVPNSQYYFVPGQTQLGLSDGGPTSGNTSNNADGNQSSHWRFVELNGGVIIGIMDPKIPPGARRDITPADEAALNIFGYNSSTPPPPFNDNFANAHAISGCSGTVNGTNVSATEESGEPDHVSSGGTRTVWYQWQAPVTGNVTITTAGSLFDTVLGVYKGTAVNSLETVKQNDDVASGTLTSFVEFQALAGDIYRIAVGGFNNGNTGGDVGPIALNWNQTGCTNSWAPTALTSSQAELKSWTIAGRTSIYAKLNFPDAGYRVSNWGTPVQAGNAFSANATIEKFNGVSAQAVTNTAQIYDLGQVPAGNYTFTFLNLGATVKTLNFSVSFATPPANPIDDAQQFVRWQYKDFLRREPDGPGWAHWTGEITQCSDPTKRLAGETEPQCVDRKRTNTSAAFFLSPEFQNTGYFVLRVYRGSLGRMPHFGGSGTANDEFTRDAGTVSAGIVVNNALAPGVINANKQAFVNAFVTRAEFRAIYDGLSNAQYVDRLFQTTGVTPTAAERQALIDGLGSGSETRASVLFKVVDGTQTLTGGVLQFQTNYGKAFYDKLFNAAFVQMEYFGYLLRDPDDGGYAFWLGKLNQVGNWVDAQMVRAFIQSPEYRSRFGAP